MNSSVSNYKPQNVPFVNGIRPACGTPSHPSAEMTLLGYQCVPGSTCSAVNQFNVEVGKGPLYFSAAQCSQVCGGMEKGVYVPKKVFD